MTRNRAWLLFGIAMVLSSILLTIVRVITAANEVPVRTPLGHYAIPEGHSARSAEFLPSGNEVVFDAVRDARPDKEGYLHFFDAKTDQLVRSIEHPSYLWGNMVFVDGGKKLVTCGANDKLRVYGGEEWKEIDSFEKLPGDSLHQMTTDAKGTHLAMAVIGEKGPRLWDVNRKTVVKFPDPSTSVNSVALSPDGTEMAIAYPKRVEFYDTATVKRTAILPVEGSPNGFRYTPDGKKLIAGFVGDHLFPGLVRVWDAATRKLLHTCTGAQGAVYKLFVTPDSKYALSSNGVSDTGTGDRRVPFSYISVWSLESGAMVEQFDPGKYGGSVALSPDGNTLVTIGDRGTAHKWDFAAIRKEFEAKLKK